MIRIEFEVHISKNGLVKLWFGRPLSVDEAKILDAHGFRWSRWSTHWTHKSSTSFSGAEDLWELVTDPAWNKVKSR